MHIRYKVFLFFRKIQEDNNCFKFYDFVESNADGSFPENSMIAPFEAFSVLYTISWKIRNQWIPQEVQILTKSS